MAARTTARWFTPANVMAFLPRHATSPLKNQITLTFAAPGEERAREPLSVRRTCPSTDSSHRVETMRGAYVNNAETEEAPATAPVSTAIAKPRNGASAATIKLARRLGLRHVSSDVLSIRRRRCGKGWTYLGAGWPHHPRPRHRAPAGTAGGAAGLRRRALRRGSRRSSASHRPRCRGPAAISLSLRLGEGARDPQGGAAGAAGRCSAAHTPQRGSASFRPEPTREFALAAVIELVACSAIRPGSESYARQHGTRGATTLLKSNVTLDDTLIRLTFTAKGGQKVVKEVVCPRLSKALEVLRQVPGRRLFQYRTENGSVRPVRRRR